MTSRSTGRPIATHPPTAVEHRNAVVAELAAVWSPRPAVTGPVAVELTFRLARPAGHHGTGRNAGQLRPSAPAWPACMPDLDKLARLVLDALVIAAVLGDDGQVVALRAVKHYADDGPPGTMLDVWAL